MPNKYIWPLNALRLATTEFKEHQEDLQWLLQDLHRRAVDAGAFCLPPPQLANVGSFLPVPDMHEVRDPQDVGVGWYWSQYDRALGFGIVRGERRRFRCIARRGVGKWVEHSQVIERNLLWVAGVESYPVHLVRL